MMGYGTQESIQYILTDGVRVGDRILKGCKAFRPSGLVLSDHRGWITWFRGVQLFAKGLEMLTVEEILFLSAEQNYTDFFYWQSGKKQKLTASLNLKAYETHFGQYPEFMKVHRSYVVNLMLVDRFLRGENVLVMRDGQQIFVPVSLG